MAYTLMTSRKINNVDTTWSLTNVTESSVLSNNEQVWTVMPDVQAPYFFYCSNTGLKIAYTDGTTDLGDGLEAVVSNHQLNVYVDSIAVGSLSSFDVVGSSSYCYLFFIEDAINQNAIPVLMTFYWTENDNRNHCTFKWLSSLGTKALYNWVHGISNKHNANGGGATHIAKVTGQLKNLSSNLSDILIVSGGGGGGLLVGDTDYSGKDAGGISGSGDNSGNQSTGYGFGQGESGTNVSGGGSGLYGGYKGTASKGGGAGSGYIGNSLVSNKKMVGYNVPTSSAESTKTESVNVYSENNQANKPKAGNGFAKIKFLRPADDDLLENIVKTKDITHVQTTSYDGIPISNLSQYFGTDWILVCQQSNGNYFSYFDGNEGQGYSKYMGTACRIFLPIQRKLVSNFKFKAKNEGSGSYASINFGLSYLDNGQMNTILDAGAYVGPGINSGGNPNWTEFTYTLSTSQYVDYVVINVCDGKWYFKDFEFNYE